MKTLVEWTRDLFGGHDMPPLIAPPRAELATRRIDLEAVSAYDTSNGRSFLESRKQPWQDEGWRLSREIGEWGALLDWRASALSRIRWYVARVPDSGSKDSNPVPVTNPVLTAPLDRLSGDDPNGFAAKTARYWKQTDITGESYLVGYREDPNDPESSVFDFASSDELVMRVTEAPDGDRRNQARVAYRVDEDQYIPLHPDWSSVQRIWRRDAQYGWLATAPTEYCLPILRVLRLLDQRVSSEALSRIWSSGLLCIGEGAYLPMPPPEAQRMFPDEDPQMQMIKWMVSVGIRNPGEASAASPILLNANKSDVGLVELATEFSKAVPELVDLYIRRLAMSSSAPPEMVLGRSDDNHWTSAWVNKDIIEIYLKDDAADFAAALTTGHLRPWYRAVGVKDPHKYMIAFDVTPLYEEPDRTETAAEDRAARVIGEKAYRRIRGYDEGDAPTAEENQRWILTQLALNNANPIQIQPFLDPLGVELGDTDQVAPASAPAVAGAAPTPPAAAPEPDALTDGEPPAPPGVPA